MLSTSRFDSSIGIPIAKGITFDQALSYFRHGAFEISDPPTDLADIKTLTVSPVSDPTKYKPAGNLDGLRHITLSIDVPIRFSKWDLNPLAASMSFDFSLFEHRVSK